MESLKQKGAKLYLFNREWELSFTTNVIDDIQDHFDLNINTDGVTQILSMEKLKSTEAFNIISYFIMSLINEQIETENDDNNEKNILYTEKQVRRRVKIENRQECYDAIISAYTSSWMKKDEDTEEETP